MADETGETALHAVAYTGTLEQLQLCLPSCHDADAAIRLHTSHGELPLHYAAAGGREDIVEFLLSRGCNVDSANANGWTPLICTLMPTDVKSIYPKYSLASLLLQQGASAQVVTEEGWTALHGLASYPSTDRDLPPEKWEGVAPLVRELISRGAPLDTESSVLRSRSVTRGTLIKSNAWGIRMRWFAQEAATSAPPESLEIVEDRDTTPHMWAYRTGAMEVFNTVLAHWGSVSEAER
jgi:ankyrin repeat protein